MNEMQKSKLQPALIGGACLGVASAIPILNLANCACCGLVLGGGFLASYLYMKDLPPAAQAPYGDGAIVGLLAGVVGAVVSTILSIPLSLMFAGPAFLGGLADALDDAGLPSEVERLLTGIGAGGFVLSMAMLGLVVNLLLYSIFAVVGALIGVAVFHRKNAPAAAA